MKKACWEQNLDFILPQKTICNYNSHRQIAIYVMLGNLVVLPFTIYNTVQYINSKNIKFIQFQ